MTNFSSTTQSVLANILNSSGSSSSMNLCVSEDPVSIKSGWFSITDIPGPTTYITNSADIPLNQSVAYTGIQFTGDTFQNGYVWIGDTPYTGPVIIPNGGLNDVPIFPQPAPFGGGLYPPIKIIPDLDSLEEGVHDIPGGKIIIKKIKVTEEQLDWALEEEIGHPPTDEEKSKLREELRDVQVAEEREV